MQTELELNKYVRDEAGVVYPYNAYLDELIANGKLKFCDKPPVRTQAEARAVTKLKSPTTLSPEERGALAERLGITTHELINMSPQELADSEAEYETKKRVADVQQSLFPQS